VGLSSENYADSSRLPDYAHFEPALEGITHCFSIYNKSMLTSKDQTTTLSTLEPQDGNTPTYLHKILPIVWIKFASHGVGIRRYFTEIVMKAMADSWRTDSTRVLERQGYAGRESNDVAAWGRGNKKELSRLLSIHQTVPLNLFVRFSI
jgi:hypothetical protein